MRAFSEEVYGIPRKYVIDSSLQYEFQTTAGGSADCRGYNDGGEANGPFC